MIITFLPKKVMQKKAPKTMNSLFSEQLPLSCCTTVHRQWNVLRHLLRYNALTKLMYFTYSFEFKRKFTNTLAELMVRDDSIAASAAEVN